MMMVVMRRRRSNVVGGDDDEKCSECSVHPGSLPQTGLSLTISHGREAERQVRPTGDDDHLEVLIRL